MTRLAHAWREMTGEQRLAFVAAVALFVTMLFPWYQQNAVVSAPKITPLQSRNLNAFQVFSFVEAAVLLVAVAIVYLLYARADGRDFHMPGGDGAVVLAAGSWTALLLVFRLFDKPGISSHGVAGNVGVQWGIFFALAAAGLLTYAGSRMRAARVPPPPRTARRPRARADARTIAPPPPEIVEDSDAEPIAADAPTIAQQPASAPVRSQPRPRLPPAPPSEQLSFEDPPSRQD